MELLDLVYVVLRKGLRGMSFDGKAVKVGYVYDYRVIDVAEAHWVVLYMLNESVSYFDLGGLNYAKEYAVAVDIRTDSKDVYGILKKAVLDQFLKPKDFVFQRNDNPFIIENADVKVEGVFLRRVEKEGIGDELSEGMYVKLSYDGKEEDAWIVDVESSDVVHGFTMNGVYYLIRPNGVRELSDKMKMLYRCVIDVIGRGVIWK